MSSSRLKKITQSFKIVIFTLLSVILLLMLANYVYKPRKYYQVVKKACETFDVDKFLILAIIKVESDFDCFAVSDKKACGLMQIRESTFNYVCEVYKLGYPDDSIFGVKENVFAGTAYVDYLFKKFLTAQEVLAAYNAGEGVVKGWLKNDKYSADGITLKSFPFKETEKYVKKVLFYKNYYARAFNHYH